MCCHCNIHIYTYYTVCLDYLVLYTILDNSSAAGHWTLHSSPPNVLLCVLMLRSHYLVDADSMGFREFLWANWEFSAGYMQMIGRYVDPLWHRWGVYNTELDDFIESASNVCRLVYRVLICRCPADIDILNSRGIVGRCLVDVRLRIHRQSTDIGYLSAEGCPMGWNIGPTSVDVGGLPTDAWPTEDNIPMLRPINSAKSVGIVGRDHLNHGFHTNHIDTHVSPMMMW
jgi:hypothetical protein